ncbi:MAG TPA: hypothetical protein VLS90_18020 [Thermodesulfobacteriota bacterium]|nr:hypothetical protein [Thermodesulfobacteriota bacterium]
MKDERNYHQRLQEFCDCFLETDFRKELEKAGRGMYGDPGGDPDELALKFLGVALLYGANEEAAKISLERKPGGEVLFSMEGREKVSIAPPGREVANRVFAIARSIAHIEGDEGKLPLSLGLRNDRLEIGMEFDRKKGGESLTLVFPPA